MTSREVYTYLKIEGIDKLYKKFEKYFGRELPPIPNQSTAIMRS